MAVLQVRIFAEFFCLKTLSIRIVPVITSYSIHYTKLYEEDDANVMIKYKGGISGHLWASSVNVGSLSGLRIRVMGSKASLSWWAERPNQMTYEVAGEPIRILERGMSYLYDVAVDEDRIGAGHSVGLFESWSNIYRRFAKAMEAVITSYSIHYTKLYENRIMVASLALLSVESSETVISITFTLLFITKSAALFSASCRFS